MFQYTISYDFSLKPHFVPINLGIIKSGTQEETMTSVYPPCIWHHEVVVEGVVQCGELIGR